jgi:hypothetical protein
LSTFKLPTAIRGARFLPQTCKKVKVSLQELMIFAAVWLAIAILDFQHAEAIEEVKLR